MYLTEHFNIMYTPSCLCDMLDIATFNNFIILFIMSRNIFITRKPMKPWARPGDTSACIWSVVYQVSCLSGQ